MPMKKRMLALFSVMAVVGALTSSFAVSDGHYDYRRNHCSGAADNTDKPEAEPGCYTLIATISDGTGHEYIGAGIRQTPEHTRANTVDLWIDGGFGRKTIITFDASGGHHMKRVPGTPIGPSTGLRVYFGADDNLDGGEHDSSPQVNNGPSDGGGMVYDVDPSTADAWMSALRAMDGSALLQRPLPVGSAGMGFCADGICGSITTERRVAFEGGNAAVTRDVSDYEGKSWDPESCAGPSDTPADCGGVPLSDWNDREGTTYVQPGIQIFEDPDAQASPIGPYPLPALYVGTCGVIIGGGRLQFPASPFTNTAGQLEIRTAC
jgi:hypothetical protein